MSLYFRVKGFPCPDCADELINDLQNLPGVSAVDFDFTGQILRVFELSQSELASKLCSDFCTGTCYPNEVCPLPHEEDLPKMVMKTVLEFDEDCEIEQIDPNKASLFSAQKSKRRLLPEKEEMKTFFVGLAFFVAGLLKLGAFLTSAGTGISCADCGGIAAAMCAHASKYSVMDVLFFTCAWLILGGNVISEAFTRIKSLKRPDEHVLMTVAGLAAFATFNSAEAVAVMFFYRIGEIMKYAAAVHSRNSAESLIACMPDTVLLITEQGNVECNLDELNEGDRFLLPAGGRNGADALIEEGGADCDLSALTGESLPKAFEKGDTLPAGAININGRLVLKALKKPSDSAVAKIRRLVADAAMQKTAPESFVAKFSAVYTPIMLLLAIIVACKPLYLPGADLKNSINSALMLIVIACPCALVLSVPMAYVAGMAKAAAKGVFVKGGIFLEALAGAKKIYFDKTGTLSKGEFALCEAEFSSTNKEKNKELIHLGMLLESNSSHPLAKAFVRSAKKIMKEEEEHCHGKEKTAHEHRKDRGATLEKLLRAELFDSITGREHESGEHKTAEYEKYELFDYAEIGGKGLWGEFEKKVIKTTAAAPDLREASEEASQSQIIKIAAGKADFVEACTGREIPAAIKEAYVATSIFLASSEGDVLRWDFTDTPLADASDTLNRLRDLGIKDMFMLTGDNFRAASKFADITGIENFKADLLPGDKMQAISGIDDVYVGDGINDAPALKKAAVGISFGDASDAAAENADILIVSGRLAAIADAISIGRKVRLIAQENIYFTLGVKLFVMLAAIIGYAGILPAVLADTGVAVLALLNSLRILRGEAKKVAKPAKVQEKSKLIFRI